MYNSGKKTEAFELLSSIMRQNLKSGQPLIPGLFFREGPDEGVGGGGGGQGHQNPVLSLTLVQIPVTKSVIP